MKLIITVITLGILLTSPLMADEMEPPTFNTPPIEYINKHEIAFRAENNRQESVADTLLIGDVTNTNAKIYIETISNNYHTCTISGVAKNDGETLIYSYKNCSVQIKHNNNEATINDTNNNCEQYFCGRMGSLNVTFKRK